MRRLPRPIATVLTTAAGALLLVGCSTGEDNTATTTSQAPVSTTSSAAQSSAGGEAAAFCTQAQPLFTQVGSAFDAVGEDIGALSSALQQAVDAFNSVEAPTAIAQDWATARDGFAGLRDTVAGIDPAAPDALAQVQAAEQQAQTEVAPAVTRVGAYIEQNCGAGSSGSSAPAS
jgi:hypothetical protein